MKNLDCFKGEYVVIEIDGETRDIPRELVDETVSVSDVVILKQGKWYTDKEATNKRSQQIKSLMDNIRKIKVGSLLCIFALIFMRYNLIFVFSYRKSTKFCLV